MRVNVRCDMTLLLISCAEQGLKGGKQLLPHALLQVPIRFGPQVSISKYFSKVHKIEGGFVCLFCCYLRMPNASFLHN